MSHTGKMRFNQLLIDSIMLLGYNKSKQFCILRIYITYCEVVMDRISKSGKLIGGKFRNSVLKLVYEKGTCEIIIYFCTVCIFLFTKLFYNSCDVSELKFMLAPVAKLTGLFTGIVFEFVNGVGYYGYDSSIIIGEGCAGLNFFIILMCMLVFSFVRYFKGNRSKILAFFAFIAASYVFTVIINSFRIISSITIMELDFLSKVIDKEVLHKATGVIVYFFFLAAVYCLIFKFIRKVSWDYGKNS